MFRYFVLFVLIFSSCQEEQTSLKFTNIENQQVFYVNKTIKLEGSAGTEIDVVSLEIDGSLFNETEVNKDGDFVFEFVFSEVRSTVELELVGFNADREEVSRSVTSIRIKEEPAPIVITDDWANFSLRESASEDLKRSKDMWGTYYYLMVTNEVRSGVHLRDKKENKLGVQLSKRDWCYAAIEGSVQVRLNEGGFRTFNYSSISSKNNTDCSKYVSSKGFGKTKWYEIDWMFGHGVRNYKLIPYRTIAIDRKQTNIPFGTVLYVPAAKGVEITLPDGSKAIHDGYFFAGDTGGILKEDQVDFYIGPVEGNAYRAGVNPFNFLKSRADQTFKTYVVKDQEIINYMNSIH